MGLSTNSENFPKKITTRLAIPGCDIRERMVMRQTQGKIREGGSVFPCWCSRYISA